MQFRSEEEVKIAEALDRAGVLFCSNSKIRLTTSEGRENQESNFLVFYEGKWGILLIGYQDADENEERDRIFQSPGISIIQHYNITQCSEQPDAVVQEFLEILSQT